MTEILAAMALGLMTLVSLGDDVVIPQVNWCGMVKTTGYVRQHFGPNAKTYDGTSIYTDENIVAASWDIRLGAMVTIEDVGTFRVADRGGGLGNGYPTPWLDVATWSLSEAYALTGMRKACIWRARN